jgi:hypothetical protein
VGGTARLLGAVPSVCKDVTVRLGGRGSVCLDRTVPSALELN